MLLICSNPLQAWGPEGHRVIALAGFGLLDDSARLEVLSILGDPSTDELETALGEACIWPDTIRDQPGWQWSSPLHYVNIPRHSDRYDRERDCAEGRCVTEGILQFANQLTWPQMEHEKRWQAFAFVCHLVADIHQPLHAGFRDDRGGNTVEVIYSDQEWNLHQVWDGVIVRQRLDDESRMVEQLVSAGRRQEQGAWAPSDVRTWTDQSHALALASAYPAGRMIDEEFAIGAWQVTLLQWERAAIRLAALLNATLGDRGGPEGD